jgi:hypothetical protein
MTRLYIDTEFLEDGATIELISIGLVSEGGHHFYGINREAPLHRIAKHDWLLEHVVPSLPLKRWNGVFMWGLEWDEEHPDSGFLGSKKDLAEGVRKFITQFASPQLFGWYSAYDHVALAQLWGRMIDLPEGVPMYTGDLKQEAVRLGNPKLPGQLAGEHNALEDARWNRRVHEYLMYLEAKRGN